MIGLLLVVVGKLAYPPEPSNNYDQKNNGLANYMSNVHSNEQNSPEEDIVAV